MGNTQLQVPHATLMSLLVMRDTINAETQQLTGQAQTERGGTSGTCNRADGTEQRSYSWHRVIAAKHLVNKTQQACLIQRGPSCTCSVGATQCLLDSPTQATHRKGSTTSCFSLEAQTAPENGPCPHLVAYVHSSSYHHSLKPLLSRN